MAFPLTNVLAIRTRDQEPNEQRYRTQDGTPYIVVGYDNEKFRFKLAFEGDKDDFISQMTHWRNNHSNADDFTDETESPAVTRQLYYVAPPWRERFLDGKPLPPGQYIIWIEVMEK